MLIPGRRQLHTAGSIIVEAHIRVEIIWDLDSIVWNSIEDSRGPVLQVSSIVTQIDKRGGAIEGAFINRFSCRRCKSRDGQ